MPKKKIAYVPWVALASFVIVIVGMSVWASGASHALSSSYSALSDVSVSIDSYLSTIHSAGVGAVVCVTLMSCVIVLMSGARTCLEKAVDERGKAVCGSWLWLAVEAFVCTVVWVILFWLVFVVFGSCLWYASAYGAQNVLIATVSAAKAANATSDSSTGPVSIYATNGTYLGCPAHCLNLAYFGYAQMTTNGTCFCNYQKLQSSLRYSEKAYSSLGSVVAGSFVMWVGASFMLMSAVGDFSRTRRERELLLRAQRQAAEMSAASMALGTAPAYMTYSHAAQDNIPLLKMQQMQQQQQLQMQMAQMQQMPAPVSVTVAPQRPTSNMGAMGGMGNQV